MKSMVRGAMADDESKMSRRLSAVLLADMKGYSALMGEDEAHAIAGVDDIAAVFQDVVSRRGGTYEIGSGDRFFAIFESAVEALEAALEIQRTLAGADSPGATRSPSGSASTSVKSSSRRSVPWATASTSPHASRGSPSRAGSACPKTSIAPSAAA